MIKSESGSTGKFEMNRTANMGHCDAAGRDAHSIAYSETPGHGASFSLRT